jgi:hypothetical protein
MKESATSSHIRLAAAQLGDQLWRNNSGGFFDNTGRFVRYGLGSFTDKDEMKSSDYIGIKPTFITPQMVGTVLGVFTAVEMKAEGWKFYQSEKRALHQRNFHDIVRANGGYAGFAIYPNDYRRITGRD